MNNSDPIAALEIGTSNTVIAIGEPLEGGRIRISAMERIPSKGVRKSQIIDIAHTKFSIDSVLKQLSEKSGYEIAQAYLVVSGPQIRTRQVTGQSAIESGTVTDENIDEAEAKAYDNEGLAQDREAIEMARVSFSIDDIKGISSPKGMSGRTLTIENICIHGSAQRIQDARKAAHSAKLEILPETFFAGSCAAAAVLTPQNRREGALVIDLGGGSTAYYACVDGHLKQAGVIGVGGDHVTSDIRTAFSISLVQAETIKTEFGSATISPDDASQRISVPDPMPGFKAATISKRALNTVINARMQELFAIIREKMDEENILHKLNAGIVLTGGGSAMKGVAEIASSVFGCPVKVGTLISDIEGLEQHPYPASCAVMAGLLLLARNENSPDESFLDSFKKAFGGFFK